MSLDAVNMSIITLIYLHKCVSIGYTSTMAMKDSGLRIRVDRDLRERFLEICRAQDKPAAQVIREFMRRYIDENSQVIAGNSNSLDIANDEKQPDDEKKKQI